MLLLLLCNVFTLSAAEELYAQHYNVTLSLRNATVKEAVDAVTRQTGIAFSYESSVGVMPLGNVEIRVDGGAVDAVLGPLFADQRHRVAGRRRRRDPDPAKTSPPPIGFRS